MVQNLAISIPNNVSIDSSSSSTLSIDSPKSDSTDISINSFAEIPLTALSKTSRRQLSNLLNSRKILRSEEGYERDWRGIAALSQQKYLCDETTLCGEDPMSKVIQLWCKNNPEIATFANLERFLGIIDRWDVCDDIYENLVEDAKAHNTLQQKNLSKVNLCETDSAQITTNNDTIDDFGHESNPNILTKDDVSRALQGLPPQQYDAFVLFADEDINYAIEMISKLEENPKYCFKLCIKDRDLLAGTEFSHLVLSQLIEERCKFLILILTHEFFKSRENTFLVHFTEVFQMQHKKRKIIPIIYNDAIKMPLTLKAYTKLKYNSSSGLFDFWGKLASSIQNYTIMENPTPAYTKDMNSPVTQEQKTKKLNTCKTKNVQQTLSPNFIPSIKINDCSMDDDELPKIKQEVVKSLQLEQPQKQNSPLQHPKFIKNSSLRQHFNNKSSLFNSFTNLRNAHSTSQLNTELHYKKDINNSLSDLSTTSSLGNKKKKKWSNKLLKIKKVFSRSTTKLQEPI